MKLNKIGVLLLAAAVGSCSGLPIDPSPDAMASNAATLVISSCDGYVSSGLGKCTVVEGSPVDSAWRVIVPVGGALISGELSVKMRDVVRTYAIDRNVIEVPWRDLFGAGVWKIEDSGVATARATVRWKDSTGIERVVQAKGHVLLVVNARDYVDMPIDSGFAAWSTECKISYSTAGRSSVSCR